ncbi:hypothetical protein D9756_010082 [Leucocoprinus leucothites]|uniref:Uncharacterized protein n=1 Tax=Leucocoprinus leucothites TaxID=201217 RepID=A0A8H5CR27_9AGAR|nr:hypothetical protein D9756_010082 [Leucoagaricus leucothites]
MTIIRLAHCSFRCTGPHRHASRRTLLIRDGMDYTGSINLMRFDLVARSVYVSITSFITSLLQEANVDPHEVDEIVYVGGSASLPGLDKHITVSGGFRKTSKQRHLISEITDPELRAMFTANGENVEVRAPTKTLRVLLPGPSNKDDPLGGTWVPTIQKDTAPPPARRAVRFEVELSSSNKIYGIDRIHPHRQRKPHKPVDDDDEENADKDKDEEEEEVEIKSKQTTNSSYLGSIRFTAKLEVTHWGKSDMVGRAPTAIDVMFIVGVDAS